MQELVENAGQILALLLSFLVLVGLVAKYVVLPWLEDRFAPLARQVTETHRQVTVNGHISDDPTLVDRVDSNQDAIHAVRDGVRELKGETRRDLADLRQDMSTIGRLYDDHIEWSAREAGALWAALIELRDGVRHDENDGNTAEDERNTDE